MIKNLVDTTFKLFSVLSLYLIVEYFTIDFQLDFLKYLDKNNGFFLKSEINHIIDILEVIMNISFNANISKLSSDNKLESYIMAL